MNWKNLWNFNYIFYPICFVTGNAILLITATALNDSCKTENCPKWVNIELLRAIICLECMIVAFMWTKYIVAVKKFKKENKRPDVYREEFRRKVLNKGNFKSSKNMAIIWLLFPWDKNDTFYSTQGWIFYHLM